MVLNVVSSLDNGPTQPVVTNPEESFLSGNSQGEHSALQKLQTQRMKLDFLRKCTKLKRPPTSLRIKGASSIPETSKLHHFSVLETLMLGEAIKSKVTLVKRLVSAVKSGNQSGPPLQEAEVKSLENHLQKKLTFYKHQEDNMWTNWPQKSPEILLNIRETRKKVNYKNKANRAKRQTERAAKKLIVDGSVVILVKEQIPPGAISVLGKGLGFVPTPKVNIEDTRLDMRLTTNRILKSSNKSLRRRNQSESSSASLESSQGPPAVPTKLFQKSYYSSMPSDEHTVNDIVKSMESELDQKLIGLRDSKPTRSKQNLTKDEQEGLKWLECMSGEGKLAVVPADKGGAILIVYPDSLRKKTLEKLENPDLYTKLDDDPTHKLHRELFDKWIEGKEKKFIHPSSAKQVMGVSDNDRKDGEGPTNRPSTASYHKPGKAYFYPSLKIHKLKREELVPGVEPPVRLVTALHEGIAKRSDVFLASEFLKNLEKDYCEDLLTDSTDALRWLENANAAEPDKQALRAFTFDFKALYDSLDPSLVKEALLHAMEISRPDWTSGFCEWLIDLVDISLRASIGCYENQWYVQKRGVPTGGSLCVQIANITVYYVMYKCVYSNSKLMKRVRTSKRYIDDGAGFFNSTEHKFKKWIGKVNDALQQYGLLIDEYQYQDIGQYVAFLDIKFCFDSDGTLQTDLHVKETDSRNYLHFSSAHPNHIYSGIVYSQCIRLRRIINSQERLKIRLEELKRAFKDAGYPNRMVDNIGTKVLNSERNLDRRKPVEKTEDEPLPIRVVSTFGSDSDLVSVVRKYEDHLQRTRSFSESGNSKQAPTSGDLPSGKHGKKLFQFVKKTGSNLRNRLVKVKDLALGNRHGQSSPCNQKNCGTCYSINKTEEFVVNGRKVKSAPGTCITYNVIYLVLCKICNRPYIGRSVRMLRIRFGEHRRAFYRITEGKKVDIDDDAYSIGLHLYTEHGLRDKADFNRNVNVCILDNASPSSIDVKEHRYIHLLKTLRPLGMNTVNPFKIPLLH